MQYSATTPEEYLETIENDWRKEKLLAVRKMIQDNDADLEEGIAYKMLSYGYANQNIFHLNAQSAYVSLYVGDISKVEQAETLLAPFNLGKGCIRIKKRVDLAETQLNEFIKLVIEKNKQGGDTGC